MFLIAQYVPGAVPRTGENPHTGKTHSLSFWRLEAVREGRQEKMICEVCYERGSTGAISRSLVKPLLFISISHGGKLAVGKVGHLPLNGYWSIHASGMPGN